MILICGISGLVGYELSNYLDTQNIQYIGTYKTNKINKQYIYKLDYSNPLEIETFLIHHKITSCVFCIVERLTDKCENAWNEIKTTNIDLVHNMSYLCNKLNIFFIHLSTDYVFDGFTQPNYPDSKKNPLQNYGISKLISELRVENNCKKYCIIRIPVLYTDKNKLHNNAVSLIGKSIMDLRKNIIHKEDNHNIRRPLYIRDLCPFLLDILNQKNNGIYHFFNPINKYTKYEISVMIAKELQIESRNIIPNNELNNSIAPRPYDTELADTKYSIKKYVFTDFNETIQKCFSKYICPKINIYNKDKIFLLIDLDNTLINSEIAHYNAYKNVFNQNNITFVSFEQWKNITNTSNIDSYLLSIFGNIQNVNNIKKQKLDFLLNENIDFTKNSDSFLRFLINNEFNFCIVTNTNKRTTDIFKSKLPLLEKVSQWIVREDYMLPKPNDECYKLAINKYKKNEEYIIGIEDSVVGYNALQSITNLIFIYNNIDIFNQNDCYLFNDYEQILYNN